MALLALLWLTALNPTPAQAAGWKLDGDRIDAPLSLRPASINRGRQIVVSRQVGMCTQCHAGPFPEQPSQGNIGPDLTGVGKRLSVAQLRAWMVAARDIKPDSKMPNYLKVDDLKRVVQASRDQPILNEQQIEDVVAFLASLTDPP